MKQMIVDIRKLAEKVDYLIAVNQNISDNNNEPTPEDVSDMPTSMPEHLIKLNEDLENERIFNNMVSLKRN